MDTPRVVIVGAAPTGLASACELLTGGISVRVLERTAVPARTSRALGPQPRGIEVLGRLGALGDLPQRSLRIHQIVVSVTGRELRPACCRAAHATRATAGAAHLAGRDRGRASRPAGDTRGSGRVGPNGD